MVIRMMGYGSGLGFGFEGVLWMLGGILLVVGLVVLVVWAVSRATTHGGETKAPERPEALDILRARFARGEISEAEYKQAVDVLRTDR